MTAARTASQQVNAGPPTLIFSLSILFFFATGTLTGKSIELVKILQKRRVNIACVQEIMWVGSRAKDADGYKLWYLGVQKGKHGVGILMDKEHRESMVEVRRVNDRLMIIKLVVGECTLNIVSAYAAHAGLDEEVKRRFWERKKRFARGRPRIMWGALTKDKSQELERRLSAMGAWRSSGDASTMWSATSDYIREAAREVLGVSTGISCGHKGDWRWNEVVQGKVETKKVAHLKLVGRIGEEERRACMERYKVSRKKAKLAVTKAKTAAYGHMYEELGKKPGIRSYFGCQVVREEGSGFGPSEMHQG
ncbi:uncharacterized protein [Nicotiana tomentosiformis]|uniref:uncharacterized protein n=1 Tax=Nicotiana tomentosiformis TaxID=4098 RepID=UPI00388CC7FD